MKEAIETLATFEYIQRSRFLKVVNRTDWWFNQQKLQGLCPLEIERSKA